LEATGRFNTLKTPIIVSSVDLGDSKITSVRNVFVVETVKEQYPAIELGNAFVYLDETGIHRLYYKIVGGLKYIYLDDKFASPVYGSLKNIVYYPSYIGLVFNEGERDAFLLIHDKTVIHEFKTYTIGALFKKTLFVKNLNIGFAGGNLILIGEVFGEDVVKPILVKSSNFRDFTYRIIDGLKFKNWNGQWLSYIVDKKDKVEQYILRFNGEIVESKIEREVYGDEFINAGHLIHYSPVRNVIVLVHGRVVKALDLRKGELAWQNIFERDIRSFEHEQSLDKVIVYDRNNLYMISIEDGSIVSKLEFEQPIGNVVFSGRYLIVSRGRILNVYEYTGESLREYGVYVLNGNIVSMNIYGDELIIVYELPGNIYKAMHISLGNTIEFQLEDLSLISHASIELPLKDFKPEVQILSSDNPNIRIVKKDDSILLADLGSEPGLYTIDVLINIPDRLPVLKRLNVRIKSLESIFSSISIQPQLVISMQGVYMPVKIILEGPMDELSIVMIGENNLAYGSSHILHDLHIGEHVIPVYILWAKQGVYDVELLINGWSKRNRIVQRIRARVEFDTDIIPLYARFYADTVYIWSPCNIVDVNISTKKGLAIYNLRQSLKTGWNEVESLKGEYDEITIQLSPKTRCRVVRGKSWIEFLK